MDITEERIGVFFSQFREVAAVSGKTGIATGDYVLQITLIRKNFVYDPDILTCRSRNIFVVVESCRLNCWACCPAGDVSRVCPGKNPTPSTSSATPTTSSGEALAEVVDMESPANLQIAPMNGQASSRMVRSLLVSRLLLLLNRMSH